MAATADVDPPIAVPTLAAVLKKSRKAQRLNAMTLLMRRASRRRPTGPSRAGCSAMSQRKSRWVEREIPLRSMRTYAPRSCTESFRTIRIWKL